MDNKENKQQRNITKKQLLKTSNQERDQGKKQMESMKERIVKLHNTKYFTQNILLVTAIFFILPLMMFFAFYVQFHGEISPGGGFQAGVIFAASYILLLFMFDSQKVRIFMPIWLLKIILLMGVVMYIGTGFLSMFLGGNFLEYDVLASDKVLGQHLGLLTIELGVGFCVFASMSLIITMFYKLTEKA